MASFVDEDVDKPVVAPWLDESVAEVVDVEPEYLLVAPLAGAPAEVVGLLGPPDEGPYHFPPGAVGSISDEAVVLHERLEPTFDEKGVGASEDADRAFHGTYATVRDGRVLTVEREFAVYESGAHGDESLLRVAVHEVAHVDVPDREGPEGEVEEAIVDERDRTVELAAGAGDDQLRDVRVAEAVEEWHRSHDDWP